MERAQRKPEAKPADENTSLQRRVPQVIVGGQHRKTKRVTRVKGTLWYYSKKGDGENAWIVEHRWYMFGALTIAKVTCWKEGYLRSGNYECRINSYSSGTGKFTETEDELHEFIISQLARKRNEIEGV